MSNSRRRESEQGEENLPERQESSVYSESARRLIERDKMLHTNERKKEFFQFRESSYDANSESE